MGLDRRTFVKGCVGVASAGALGAITLGSGRPISDVRVKVKAITYPAIHVIKGSPAPYGLPLLPTTINGSGELVGRHDVTEEQLDWYKYCAHERAPGLTPNFRSDNKLRFFVTQDKLNKGLQAWYKDFIGNPVRARDFPDPSESAGGVEGPHGAPINWRSEEVSSEDLITGITMLMPKSRLEFLKLSNFTEDQLREWIPEDPRNPDNVFVSFVSFCTHFCCVPGWKETELAKNSSRGPYATLWDTVFCTCHLSAYDPLKIQTYDRNIFIFTEPEGE